MGHQRTTPWLLTREDLSYYDELLVPRRRSELCAAEHLSRRAVMLSLFDAPATSRRCSAALWRCLAPWSSWGDRQRPSHRPRGGGRACVSGRRGAACCGADYPCGSPSVDCRASRQIGVHARHPLSWSSSTSRRHPGRNRCSLLDARGVPTRPAPRSDRPHRRRRCRWCVRRGGRCLNKTGKPGHGSRSRTVPRSRSPGGATTTTSSSRVFPPTAVRSAVEQHATCGLRNPTSLDPRLPGVSELGRIVWISSPERAAADAAGPGRGGVDREVALLHLGEDLERSRRPRS